MSLTREQIADLIARKSITSGSYDSLLEYQKTIDGDKNSATYGQIIDGRETNQKMLIFRSDYYANPEDQPYIDDGNITGSFDASWHDSWDPFGDGGSHPHNLWLPPNVGQFVEFQSGSVAVDPSLFKELVDTTITELIPNIGSTQDRIDNFFNEYFALRGEIPPYINSENGEIDLESQEYINFLADNSISYMQDNALDDTNGKVTRLNTEANDLNTIDEGSDTYRTLEFLYKDIQMRLKDVQFANDASMEDDRDEYEDEGDGYMEIANLNDALLINNAADENQSGDTGIADEDDDCVGLDQTACEDTTDNLDCVWDGSNCYTGTGV
tara:strand:- start:1354 stop:2331 length:978 start_codon:yes stop_codon:yes gene_type:complete